MNFRLKICAYYKFATTTDWTSLTRGAKGFASPEMQIALHGRHAGRSTTMAGRLPWLDWNLKPLFFARVKASCAGTRQVFADLVFLLELAALDFTVAANISTH
ncbi:MAG: hypothetical protein Q8P42_05820 [Gallionella sp.]|nr:hypothetical protein [Gallionella sp.]